MTAVSVLVCRVCTFHICPFSPCPITDTLHKIITINTPLCLNSVHSLFYRRTHTLSHTLSSPASSLVKVHSTLAQQCSSEIHVCFEVGTQLRLFPATTCSPSRKRRRDREKWKPYKVRRLQRERERKRERQRLARKVESWKVFKEQRDEGELK